MGIIAKAVLALVAVTGVSCRAEAFAPINRTRTVLIDDVIQKDDIKPLGVQLLKWAGDESGAPVNVIINSPGGEVYAGYEFISQLEAAKELVPVRCYVSNLAASMAFQILLHCSERHVLTHAFLLFHRVRVVLPQSVMTAPIALALARDLQLVDNDIWNDMLKYLKGMNIRDMRYHFEKETLHSGAGLAALDPTLFDEISDSIPDLMDIVNAPGTVMRASQYRKSTFFDLFKSGAVMYLSPYWVNGLHK